MHIVEITEDIIELSLLPSNGTNVTNVSVSSEKEMAADFIKNVHN